MASTTSFKFLTKDFDGSTTTSVGGGGGGGGGGGSLPSNIAYTNIQNTFSVDQNFDDEVRFLNSTGNTVYALGEYPSSDPQLAFYHRTTGGGDTELMRLTLAGVSISTDLTVSNNVTITGNLTVNGTQFISNTETVEVEDNLLIINNGEVGAGVTAGSAGIEVDRGTATNYQFLFEESSDLFKVGTLGSLQAVATRPDTITDGHFAYWNNSSNQLAFKSESDITAGDSDALAGNAITRFMLLDNSPVPTFADGDVPVYQSADGFFTNLSLATVATTNSYNDLDDLPTLFTGFSVAGDAGSGAIASGSTLTIEGGLNVSTSFLAGTLTIDASFTETDPTVPSHVKSITVTEKSNWNTAFSWGDHQLAGYGTALSLDGITGTLTLLGASSSVVLDDRYYTESEVDTLISAINTYSGWNLRANALTSTLIGEGETVSFIDGVNTTVTRSGNEIQINSTDTNNFVNSASFNTGNGVLTLGRSGLSDVTVDLDGRYVQSLTDTLDSVTDRGNTTTNSITVGGATINGNLTIDGLLLADSDDRSGLLEVHRKGASSWTGYSIDFDGQHWSFMGNAADVGLYDDTNNEWIFRYDENAGLSLRYNGSEKLLTTSAGISVTGTISATAFSGDGSALTSVNAATLGGEAITKFMLYANPSDINWTNGKVASYQNGEFVPVAIPSAAFTSFNLAATTGGSTTITDGETITFIDGLNTTATRVGNTIQIDTALASNVAYTDVNNNFSVGQTIGGNTTINGNLAVDTDTLFVDSTNDRVGINQSSPNATLTVLSNNSVNSDNLSQVRTNSELRIQYRVDDLSSMYFGGLGSTRGYIQGIDNLETGGADISLNPYGGNVGIGTISPLAKTHIKTGVSGFTGTLNGNYDDLAIEGGGNTGITILTPNANNGGIAFSDEDAEVQGSIVYRHSLDSMTFNTNGTERMRIDSSGNVGIGKSPAGGVKLDVNGKIVSGDIDCARINTDDPGLGAGLWKLGKARVASTIAGNTVVRVEIDGVDYDLITTTVIPT